MIVLQVCAVLIQRYNLPKSGNYEKVGIATEARVAMASSALHKLVMVYEEWSETVYNKTMSMNLVLSIEVDTTLSVEANVTQNASLLRLPERVSILNA